MSYLTTTLFLLTILSVTINMKTLYFVDSIFQPLERNNVEITLLGLNSYEPIVKTISANPEELRMSNHKGTIREGWYVFHEVMNRKNVFSYGNLSPIARKHFKEYSKISESIIDTQLITDEFPPLTITTINQIYSYHINVGHGNCSLILIKGDSNNHELWVVDCSTEEKNNSYRNNLDSCLSSIAIELGIEKKDLRINRFFLTHTHFDHYNGLLYLINNQYIDSNTLIYMNLFYHCASAMMTSILSSLSNLRVKFIEPTCNISNSFLRILYPECRLYRSNYKISPNVTYRIEKNPVNNSSIVYCFKLGGHSMIFPGDLEQKGINIMVSGHHCSPDLCHCDYYAVSHHGSDNGHPRINCSMLNNQNSCFNCVMNNLKVAILMGRDGAYPGIFSASVIQAYGNKIHSTDSSIHNSNPIHFIRLDWGTGNVQLF